jgi:signal transduction histidine kinase
MFWRIYLFGVLLIVAIVSSAIVGSFWFGRGPHPHTTAQGLARLLASEFGEDPAAGDDELAARLAVIKETFNQEAAVYTRDGTRLASSGDNPPPPLQPEEAADLTEETSYQKDARLNFAAPLAPKSKKGAYLVTSPTGRHPLVQLAFFLLTLLGVLAVLSYPMARTIAKPLERLTRTAKELARGNLDARAGLSRKDEVGVLGDTVDHMASELQHRLRSERELLANISHEIRTPLARIRVALELCEEQDTSLEEVRRQLGEIDDDVAELTGLLDDVMAITRLELSSSRSGQALSLPIKTSSLDVERIVSQSRRRFQADHPRHELTVELPDEAELASIPDDYVADPAFIRRAIDNLLDNAANYSDPDSPVEIEVTKRRDDLLFEVRDRGIGVRDEDIEDLFDPFFRTDRSRKRSSGGTGLGLTLCKRIVEAHGGNISARRRKGGGMCISFTLPKETTPKSTEGDT